MCKKQFERESTMGDTSRGNEDNVFGGAARASQYIEEDTGKRPPKAQAPDEEPGNLDPVEAKKQVGGPLVGVPTWPASPDLAETVSVDSTSVLFGGSAAALTGADPGKATMGVRGALARMGFPVKPGPGEVEARRVASVRLEAETIVRQATWTRAVSILVNNPKGGTGKTPTAIILAGVLASIRGGSTAVLEVSDDPGALGYRAEGNPKLGLGELVRNIDQVTSAGQLHGYTAPQTSFADVIASTGHRDPLTGEAVISVCTVIDEFYGIRVMDSGNVTTSSAFQGAVSVADVLVIPVMNAGDSVLEAIQLLEELRAAGGQPQRLADTAIAIRLTDGRPENQAVTDEVARLLHGAGVTSLHEVPYDTHIAQRQQITLAKLAPATRDAFTAAAAAVVTSLKNSVSTDH
jgi:MinD-like ATPase involved in chromosome partitioning or flagellar assembly